MYTSKQLFLAAGLNPESQNQRNLACFCVKQQKQISSKKTPDTLKNVFSRLSKTNRHHMKLDENCEKKMTNPFEIMSAGYDPCSKIVITVKFPVRLCFEGVTVKTGAQGRISFRLQT